MGTILVATVEYEGGRYSTCKDNSRPIRIYSNRYVDDDIFASIWGSKKRERLSKKEYRLVLRAAKLNERGS